MCDLTRHMLIENMEPKNDLTRCVYIIGAQGTGKTTLVNAIEDTFRKQTTLKNHSGANQPTIIREVARNLLAELDFSRDDLTKGNPRALQLQEHILAAQFEAEKSASTHQNPLGWLISDRSGIDPIVYAQIFAGDEGADKMLGTESWKVLERRMKAGVVLLCEPVPSWFSDDNTRLILPEDQWKDIDRVFRDLLATRGIEYTVVPKDMTSLEERVDFVQQQLHSF